MEKGIQQLKSYAKENDIPIDGIVLTYNDIAFSESCGKTRHHYKDGVAFKFEDEAFETVLREIEWNPTRSGEIVPVAIFDSVEIDGCDIPFTKLVDEMTELGRENGLVIHCMHEEIFSAMHTI